MILPYFPPLLFFFLLVTESCELFSPSTPAVVVNSEEELIDAISCHIHNISIGQDIVISNEILIFNQSLVMSSQDRKRLIADKSRIFLIQLSNVTFMNLDFMGGEIIGDGGAMKVEIDSRIFVENSVISHGGATRGGGISLTDSYLNLNEVHMESNVAEATGGGIDCVRSHLVALSTHFFDNHGSFGGSIALDSCLLHVEDTFVSNSTALRAGGCIYSIEGSNLEVLRTNISSCRVELSSSGLNEASQGGGIFGSNIVLSLGWVEISDCFAAVGSAFRLTQTQITISNSNIHENIALVSTMEVFGQSSDVTIADSSIYSNLVSFSSSVLCCGYGAHCTFINNIVYQNQALFSAGLNVQYNAIAIIRDCIFRENVAGFSGAAIQSNFRSQVSVTNCTFEENSATQSGGALFIVDRSSVFLMDCLFRGNKANSGGSLFVSFGSILQVTGSKFTHDFAVGHGGSIVLLDSSVAVVDHTTFTSCQAVYGGAIYAYSSSILDILNSDFLDCMASYEGGSVSAYQYSNLTISDSSFLGSKAVYGGAIFGQLHAILKLIRCSLQGNSASYMGGGIEVQDEAKLQIEDSLFLDNVAVFYGASISIMFSSLRMLRTHSEANRCEIEGGVIESIFSNVEIFDCTFKSNSGKSGGVIACLSNSTCYSTNNQYILNRASYGGVLFLSLSSWISDSDIFVSNLATSGGSVYGTDFLISKFRNISARGGSSTTGGAMTLRNGKVFEITNGLFERNVAQSLGGALYLLNVAAITLVGLTFNENFANVDGGALAVYGGIQSDLSDEQIIPTTLNISSSSFGSNQVRRRGGAIYGSNLFQLFIEKSTFDRNGALYGGAVSTASTTGIVTNSSFLYNSALVGGGGVYWIYIVEGPILNVDSSCISTGDMAIYGSFKATNVYQLTASRKVNSEENSGSQIQNPVFVDMRDYYGQIVNDITTEATGNVVYSSTADSFSSLQGSTIEQTSNGVATFGNFTVTFKPNSSVTLFFDMSNNVERAEYQIYFRSCVIGEIVLSLFGETTICSKCSPGSYSLKLNSQKCKLCPEHAVCPGGDVIDVSPGYWRMGREYEQVRLCLAKDACKGGDDPDTQCRQGHKGPYCSVCESGYYKHGGVCLSCSSSGTRLMMTLLPTLCFLFCLLLFYLWIIRDKLLQYFFSQADALTKKAETYHLTGLRTKFKILLAFVQIINQIPFALDVDFPQIYLEFLDYLWIFNLDFVEFLNFECIYQRNFYDKLVEATLGPFILITVIITLLLLRLFIAYRLNSLNPSYTYSQFRKEAIFCSLLLSFVVFSPVSITVFQTFACESFEDGTSRLITDYTIECSGSEYEYYVVYSSFMILIYPLGVPALYFALLYIYYKQVNPPTLMVVRDSERDLVSAVIIQQEKIKLRNTYEDLFVISFLYIAYEPRRWYFEILDCFRRLMMTAVPILILRGAVTQIVIVLLTSLACVAAYMELKPYTTQSDNTVAVLSQWAITLTLISSILIRIDDEKGLDRQALGIIAIIINASVFIVTFLLILLGDEEYDASGDLQNLEMQATAAKKKKKRIVNMKLSRFIERQAVEMTEKKNSPPGAEELTSPESSAHEKTNQSEVRKSGTRGSITSISRRSSVKMKAMGKSDPSTEDNSGISSPVPKRERRKSSIFGRRFSSTHVVEDTDSKEAASPEDRGSRLVKKEGKDSDDESDSDDDQGDSDDDTPSTTRKKTNSMKKQQQMATTNPIRTSSIYL